MVQFIEKKIVGNHCTRSHGIYQLLVCRSEYNPDQYLWETEFILAGRKYKRLDLEASKGTNCRGFFL